MWEGLLPSLVAVLAPFRASILGAILLSGALAGAACATGADGNGLGAFGGGSTAGPGTSTGMGAGATTTATTTTTATATTTATRRLGRGAAYGLDGSLTHRIPRNPHRYVARNPGPVRVTLIPSGPASRQHPPRPTRMGRTLS